MATPPLVTAAVVVFIVAALLFWQYKHQRIEGFIDPVPPVAGRPYGAIGELDRENRFVPSDLNKMPFAGPAAPPSTTMPVSTIRPITVPGPSTAVRDPPATQKDVQELNTQLITWIAAADQRENEHAGSLTPEQRQQRVLYEARTGNLLEQLASGVITDTQSQVEREIKEVQAANRNWQKRYPNIEEIAGFGLNEPQDKLLTSEQYDEFSGLLDAVLQNFREHPQPDPLQRVRYQQLQVFHQDLENAAKLYDVPPIKMRAARLFLQRAERADQPLPTLFAMDTCSVQPRTKTEAEAEAEAKAKTKTKAKPKPTADIFENESSAVKLPLGYDPVNKIQRARTLCRQLQEAFPNSAEALGCPSTASAIQTNLQAQNVMGTVCDRLRTSVPSISPQQFGCP